jgi:hypothetical protein
MIVKDYGLRSLAPLRRKFAKESPAILTLYGPALDCMFCAIQSIFSVAHQELNVKLYEDLVKLQGEPATMLL